MIGFIKFTAALVWWYVKYLLILGLVIAAIFAIAAVMWRALDKRHERLVRQSENRARMYELRRDRERIDITEHDREGAEYRRRREREMLGKSEPIRKAVGLFSDAAAQKAVAR